MKILALVGSPRKGGNTDLLVDQILRGSESKGTSVEKLYLYEYEIEPCLDCRKCKKRLHECSLRDEMSHIYPKLENADVIVFGTPVYWYGPSGKMKLLIDRLRPYIANGKLKGKKGVIVIPSEEGPSCCGPVTEMFRMSFEYLGMALEGCILARAYEKGEVGKNTEEMERAYQLGRAF
ncbi:MAG: flavodoxin family protein [Halobacteriota archaeon]